MATLSIESSTTVDLRDSSIISYVIARNSSVAYSMHLDWSTLFCGQFFAAAPNWIVIRGGIIFDLSELPTDADITAATLKLYGDTDISNTDFLISVSEAHLSSPPTYSDYSTFDGPLGSFVTLNTSGFAVGSFNDFVFNNTGIAYVNNALLVGEVELGIRSWNDLTSIPPTQAEYVIFKGQSDSNRPILELTYSDWPNEVYPSVPTFPAVGKINLATYAVIRNYLTGLDTDLSAIADTDGNVALDEDAWITWDGSSVKVSYDSAESNVVIDNLFYTTLTLNGDLVTVDLAMGDAISATDCTVANDAQLSDTAYATIQSKVTDNEVVFSAVSAPTPADDEGDLYMDSTTGDLMLKTRDDGQAGVKTATLADFSGL